MSGPKALWVWGVQQEVGHGGLEAGHRPDSLQLSSPQAPQLCHNCSGFELTLLNDCWRPRVCATPAEPAWHMLQSADNKQHALKLDRR